KEYPNSQNKKFIMIGDKEHDIIGANKNNIDSVGVLWGFGSKVELETHQPRYIAMEINDLRGILLTKN
ncbi:MAG: HAD hydrolase-like protein, partial [Bacteroidetes bacterium]|nr:HAD hydrolase-like protein [Bacteroidota bacterium]